MEPEERVQGIDRMLGWCRWKLASPNLTPEAAVELHARVDELERQKLRLALFGKGVPDENA